ncbi:hypothetical protein RJ641_023874 [Dillenia turbinata]|uniref:Uncharacterized protein n=1 Tax=Dillenia turbinata TaxID=194707 RepID=A0AAN8UHE1_9MAGN
MHGPSAKWEGLLLECSISHNVKNPIEENEIVGITNYIDFGFELKSRVVDTQLSKTVSDSTIHIVASWQVNKNFLVKGKVVPLSSSVSFGIQVMVETFFQF